jgi:Cytochrome c554 and c-prime
MRLALRPRLIHGAGRLLIVANLAAVTVLAAIIVVGVISSPINQPAQLLPSASPTFGLMPMGSAHIPTTNACVLCHEAGGQVKTVPVMLHPVEGWRRCTTCHGNETLGRTAPGHEGIAEEECLNCHRTAPSGPAITRPHAALASQKCLTCHGGVAHLPSTMASSSEDECVLCHQPAELPPPQYPHNASLSLGCRECHVSAEVGALPIDHALRSDETCLLCHDIKVQATPVPLPTPVPSVAGP